MTVPFDTIDPRLHGIVRALNNMGATTTGSCYEMVNFKAYVSGEPDPQEDEYPAWYVEFELPRNADGWAILTSIVQRLRGTDVLVNVQPADDGLAFHIISGDMATPAEVERLLS